jgi:hypothetical protein
VNEDRLFNQRLYHLVYHWAAYVATLVLLLSLGALVCVSPTIRYPAYLRFVNIAGGAASLFFLYRQKTLGDRVNEMVGGVDREAQWFLKHPKNMWFGGAVTVIIVIMNLLII